MADPNESFIDLATDASIEFELSRAFATRKMLGHTISLTLERDVEQDGSIVQVGPQSVLMTLASREPTRHADIVATRLGADGQFEKELPFNVLPGDTFRLPANPTVPGAVGQAGRIMAVLPAMHGRIIATFELRV